MAGDQTTAVVIGDVSIEWATVQNVKGRIVKTGSGEAPAAGAVPEGGSVTREQALKGWFSGHGGDLKGDIVICLPGDKVLLRVVELPAVEDAELSGMVELQAEKFSPFSPDSSVTSYEVLRRGDTENIVLIAVAKSDVLDAAGALTDAVQDRVEGVDVDIMGWLRLLRDGARIPGEGRRIILIKNGGFYNLVVLQDGVPLIFRSVESTLGLAESDAADEIAGEVAYTLMTPELGHGGGSVLVDVFSRDEVSPALVESLKRECLCDVNVSSFDVISCLPEGIAKRKADGASRCLDLTPVSWRLSKQARLNKKKMIAATGVLFGLWAVIAALFSGVIWFHKMRVEGLEKEKEKWAEPAGEVREMARRIHLVEQYMDRSDSALECLREVTGFLPPSGITLDSFTYRKGESLRLSGDADSRDVILVFQENLNKSAIFKKTIPGEIKVVKGRSVFSFDLMLPEGGE